MKIAIQGEVGSFHHIASQQYYGGDIDIVPCTTFKAVFETIKADQADSGIVAIENSLFGSINEVYDLLLKNNLPIVGEILVPINQCLIGFENTDMASVKNVYSHPVALAQCSNFLDKYLPDAKRIENYDTAASVELVKHLKNNHSVAIASQLAAKIYKMNTLRKNVQNHKQNFTRFLVIQKLAKLPVNSNKISMILQTNHTPGALYNALGVFDDHKINITKLQSRPIEGKPWSYMFYIDCLSSYDEFNIIQKKLLNMDNKITVLGAYKEVI
jgi:prephenate dehydratase